MIWYRLFLLKYLSPSYENGQKGILFVGAQKKNIKPNFLLVKFILFLIFGCFLKNHIRKTNKLKRSDLKSERSRAEFEIKTTAFPFLTASRIKYLKSFPVNFFGNQDFCLNLSTQESCPGKHPPINPIKTYFLH